MRILCVDNDVAFSDYATTLLTDNASFAFDLTHASSYTQALNALTTNTFDVCLLSYTFDSGHTAEKILEYIAKNDLDLLNILITDQGDPGFEVKMQRPGVYYYLAKGEVTGPLLERTIRCGLVNAKFFQEIKQLAFYDELTHLFTRRYFLYKLEESVRHVQRYEHPLSLCYCDLDNLTLINNTYGHVGGDTVLRKFGAIIASELRSGVDFAGRLGGDEICLVFPNTTPADAATCVQRISQRLLNDVFPCSDDPSDSFTASASFGVVGYNSTANWSTNHFIQEADKLLYISKSEGKNRIKVASPVPV